MEQTPNHREAALEVFRAEIARLKAEETETAHLRDIEPQELVAEDAYIYELFLHDTLDMDIFQIYRNNIQQKGSRADFAAYLGNMIGIRDAMQDLGIMKTIGGKNE